MSASEGGATNETVDLAQQAFALFNAGDLEAFRELQHPQIVMVTDRMWPGGGSYEGLEAFERFLEQFREAFSDVRFEPSREPEAIGEFALFRGRWVGTGASTGIQTESFEFSIVFGSREGLIDLARFFVSDEAARKFAAAA